MQRLLIVLGVLLVAAGLLWPWLSKLPWGRLPGDFSVEREGFSFHFPLMTSLVVSGSHITDASPTHCSKVVSYEVLGPQSPRQSIGTAIAISHEPLTSIVPSPHSTVPSSQLADAAAPSNTTPTTTKLRIRTS